MTGISPTCYMPPVIGYALVTFPGWRLGLLGVTSEPPFRHSVVGYPDADNRRDRVAVDRQYVLRRFTSGQAARRALDAARAHWIHNRDLAYDAIRREIDE